MGTPRFRSTVDRSRKSKLETSGRKVDIKVLRADVDEVTTRSPDRLVKFIANPELRLHWIEVRTVDASRMEYEWTFKVPEHETTPMRFRARVMSESSDGSLTFTIKGGDPDGSPRPRIARVWGQWQLVPAGRVFQVSFGFVVAIELGDNAVFNATVRRYMRDLDDYMKQLRRLLELAISDYDIILR